MPKIICRLECGKQPSRNDLVLIFALYFADIWSTRLVKANDFVLAMYEFPPIQLGGIILQQML